MRPDAEPAAAPLAAPAADSLRSQLADASWIDIDAGLSRVRGNESKFRQLVRLFLREHRNDLEKISIAAAEGNLQTVEQVAHALKGSAGLIGAVRVAALAMSLLESVRKKGGQEAVLDCLTALEYPFQELIEGLENTDLATVVSDAEPTPLPAHHSHHLLVLLERMLRDGDINATELASKERQNLLAMLGKSADTLFAAIDVFDYEHALRELQIAKARLMEKG